MPKKKKSRKSSHNPGLKARMKRSGKRLVHGYETASLKKRSKRKKSGGKETKKTRAKFIGFGY